MIVGENLKIGMMAKDTRVMNHCTEESIWASETNALTNCSSTMGYQKLYDRILDKCHKKGNCKFDITELQENPGD